MKNAPNISQVVINDGSKNKDSFSEFSAPSVSELNRRMQNMKSNSITLPVCGHDVIFTLETIPANMVEKATMVWSGNERDQSLLTKEALDDLIPSFSTSGQQTPAFGRKISGIVEIADGSRRRQTALYTNSDYRVLVGELDEKQMLWLSQIGNEYRPISAYEKGKRYARRLANEFENNLSSLAESENIDRKIIRRCIATANLPAEIISLFSHPGELSARSGEALSKSYDKEKDIIMMFVSDFKTRKAKGEIFSSENIIRTLLSANESKKDSKQKKSYFSGAVSSTKGDIFNLSIDTKKVSPDLVVKIENLIVQYSEEHSVREKINNSLSTIEEIVTFIRDAAKKTNKEINEKIIKGMIPIARKIFDSDKSMDEKINDLISKF